MEKTTVLASNGFGAQFYIPGFVRIDDVHQIDEYGNVELSVVYDDAKLGQVAQVTLGNRTDGPPLDGQTPPPVALGKLRYIGGWLYIFYYAQPAPNWQNEKTMVITGRAHDLEFYVPGLVAIDKLRQLDDYGNIQLFVRYNTANINQIHHISVTTVGPDRELPAGAVDLGLIHPYGSYLYVHYTDTIVPPQP